MFRNNLMRGVSAGAIAILAFPRRRRWRRKCCRPSTLTPPPRTPPPRRRRRLRNPRKRRLASLNLVADAARRKPAFVQKFQLPNTVSSVTRQEIEDKVNIIDTEDAVKYMPSLFVRKRNNGDTQPVLATRTWGVNSSARSLVYADDLLLTALIGNDNSIGAPRWGLVAPEEIERIDFLYGPFSAQYPGNSMGGVLQITTRMPEKLEMTAKETESLQDFSLYGTQQDIFHQ